MAVGIQAMKVMCVVALIAGLGNAQTKAPPPSSPPVCPYPYAGDINSRFAFAEASEVALSYALTAVQRYDIFKTATGSIGSNLIEVMSATKAASEAYRCAVLILQPFKRSTDKKVIAIGAELGAQAYGDNIALNDRFLKVLREPKPGGLIGIADELSTVEVEREKLWVDLAEMAKLATLGLMDASHLDSKGNVTEIVLRRSEKEEFQNRLMRDFPELEDAKKIEKLDAPTAIASVYRDFLKQPWVCADDKTKP
jgi:hypothetical protein